MRTVVAGTGQYELHAATMLDLIATAYGMNRDAVIGGPAWLETDRFDVIAKAQAGTTSDELHAMLKTLLADRFHLVTRGESRPQPAYLLTAGKHPVLKPAAGSDGSGCQDLPAEHSATINGVLACHNMSMVQFAEVLRTSAAPPVRGYLSSTPVVDQTGLQGAWDFTVKWTGIGLRASAVSDAVSLFDAMDKQLGLKLELGTASLPVVVVDRVDQTPTANPGGVTAKLREIPSEFEVADIKLSTLSAPTAPRMQAGGRFSVNGTKLNALIGHAWGFDDFQGMIVGGPKWIETARFDIVAKMPAELAGTGLNDDPLRLALRAMLAERFHIETHFEQQPVTVYAIEVGTPKLKKADTGNRSGCKYTGEAAGAQASALLRTYVCRNTTMAQFAEQLHALDPEYTNDHPIVDLTGLAGAWDFSLTMSGSRVFSGAGAQVNAAASDPNGAISLFDAMEKQLGLKLVTQKHPMQVLVIDKMTELAAN